MTFKECFDGDSLKLILNINGYNDEQRPQFDPRLLKNIKHNWNWNTF